VNNLLRYGDCDYRTGANGHNYTPASRGRARTYCARRDPARAVRGGALYSEFLRCLELQTVQKAWHVFGSFYIATLSPVHCLLLQVSRQIMYAYISHDNYRGKFFFRKTQRRRMQTNNKCGVMHPTVITIKCNTLWHDTRGILLQYSSSPKSLSWQWHSCSQFLRHTQYNTPWVAHAQLGRSARLSEADMSDIALFGIAAFGMRNKKFLWQLEYYARNKKSYGARPDVRSWSISGVSRSVGYS